MLKIPCLYYPSHSLIIFFSFNGSYKIWSLSFNATTTQHYTRIQLPRILHLRNGQPSPKDEKMHLYKLYDLLQIFRNPCIMGSVEVNKEFCITLSTFQRRLNPSFTTETKLLYSLYNLLKDLHCRNQSLSFCVSYKPMLY